MSYHGEVFDDGDDFIKVTTADHLRITDMEITLGQFGTIGISMSLDQARELARHLTAAVASLTPHQDGGAA